MTGDFSRWRAPNAKARGYTCVLMQQGRLYTDSDWNENITTVTERAETALSHVIGSAGTPKGDPGFEIRSGSGGFRIGAGCYYVNGLHVENPADTTYDDQSGDLGLPRFAQEQTGTDLLIYLETRKQHVTAFEDGLLNDPALSGADTGTRIRAGWRVRVKSIALTASERADLIARAKCGHVPELLPAGPGQGKMLAETAPAEPSDQDDCLIPPEAGYLHQENQLYRVQIVRGGFWHEARFVWSRENGSVVAALGQNDDGELILRGAREDDALGFVDGGVVEVFDDRSDALGEPGQMTQISISALNGTVSFSPGIGDIADYINPRVRRWDHGAANMNGILIEGSTTTLEHGIQVSFTKDEFRVGDTWMFEARAATGTVIWPPVPTENPGDPVPPMNWGVHCAPLALARRSGNGINTVIDLRAMIPPLTCLQAEDIGFDDSVCEMGADTVQEAIESLCQRGNGGKCTIIASTATELQDAVAELKPKQSARICLRGTNFQLEKTLHFKGMGHISIEGAGPQTVVSVSAGEAAFHFEDCTSVRVTDMSVNGGPVRREKKKEQKGWNGAITAINCGDSSFERLRLGCRNGPDRSFACLSTLGTSRSADVRVRDCFLRVGQAQIGIQIVGARRSRIENNEIVARFARPALVRKRIRADKLLVRRIVRGIVQFDYRRAKNLGNAELRIANPSEDGKDLIEQPVHELRPERTSQRFNLANGGSISADIRVDIAPDLHNNIMKFSALKIAEGGEMRAHIRNVVAQAVRRNGRVDIGTGAANVLDLRLLRLNELPYMAQGIVVSGENVSETQIHGNRIDGANDGIRIAASGGKDSIPPKWQETAPRNRVRRAVVSDNTIAVVPLSSVTESCGIYVGHVERMQAKANVIEGQSGPIGDLARPHFGMYQFGWRGPHLTWSENAVTGIHTGYAVLPKLDLPGLWRLRDNSADNVVREYATSGVDIK